METANGLVRLESLNIKALKAKTRNGRIELKSITAADVNVETSNGHITFDDISGKVRGKTKNGQIIFKAESIDRPIRLETGTGRILVQTEQEPTNVTFDVHTVTGKINILDYFSRSTVIGNGENLIKLLTKTGSITVE